MSEKQAVGWFTVKGKHIPIFEGESKQDALNRVIAKNNESKKQKDIERNKRSVQVDRGGKPKSVENSMYGMHKEHIDGWWEDTSYIEPGTKEWHEGYDAYVQNYEPAQQREIFHKGVKASKEQLKALENYAQGTYHEYENGKDNLVEKYNFSEIIENSKDLHLGNATLFRGADLTEKEYNELISGKSQPYLNGVTSWSLREDVAHMYAQGDPFTGETYRTMHGDTGKSHKVIFIEENTDDAMALPYAPAHNEALRSKNRKYTITKIIPESKYKKVTDIYSAANSGFDAPVTYIYVKSKSNKK